MAGPGFQLFAVFPRIRIPALLLDRNMPEVLISGAYRCQYLDKYANSIPGNIVWAHKDVERLIGPIAQIHNLASKSRDEFLADVKPGGRYGNIVGIYRHNTSADSIGIYDAPLVNALPPSVKWIAHNGAGYDQIDIAACKARGVCPSLSLHSEL